MAKNHKKVGKKKGKGKLKIHPIKAFGKKMKKARRKRG